MASSELDLDHITAVCDRLSESGVATGLEITPTRRGYAISASTTADARHLEAAFARLGYRGNRPEILGHRDCVTVTGWSRHGLNARIDALHDAITWLHRSRDRTAAAAIDHGPHSTSDLADLHDTLRTAVERHTGVITDHQPNTWPADRKTASALETTRRLELDIAAHIRWHVQTAQEAVHRYEQHRPGLPSHLARAATIIDVCRVDDPPPLWDHRPTAADQSGPAATMSGAATSAGTTGIGSGPPPHPADSLLDPDDLNGAVEVIDDHPATIAAHDHADGVDVEIVPDDGPPPPAISPNHPGPARGPATR